MLTILRPMALAFAAVLFMSFTANASMLFDAKSFQEAQASGKTILIDVYAPWCPVCKKQRPILESIQKERPSLVVFEVDFDNAKDVLKRFGVQKQSTLILFKGTSEVGRHSYDPDPIKIRALVAKGF